MNEESPEFYSWGVSTKDMQEMAEGLADIFLNGVLANE
jgi:hypothetical protein